MTSHTGHLVQQTEFLQEFGGRSFLCNAHGRPVRYIPDKHEIETIVEESLARAPGLDRCMPSHWQQRRQFVASIVDALSCAAAQGVERLEAFDMAERLAAASGQWQISSALAMDVVAVHRAVLRFGEAAVERAVQLWSEQRRHTLRFSIGDAVSVASERPRFEKGHVTSINVAAAPAPRPQKHAFQCDAKRVLEFMMKHHRAPQVTRGQDRKERELARWVHAWHQALPVGLNAPQLQLALELRIVLRSLWRQDGSAGLDACTVQRLDELIGKCNSEPRRNGGAASLKDETQVAPPALPPTEPIAFTSAGTSDATRTHCSARAPRVARETP